MNLVRSLLSSLFPFDARIDTRLGHRHLILAYCVVWAVQVCYVCYLLFQWRSAGRSAPRIVDTSNDSETIEI
jgi:hypothetical protein